MDDEDMKIYVPKSAASAETEDGSEGEHILKPED